MLANSEGQTPDLDLRTLKAKIHTPDSLRRILPQTGVVFTNGCFDLVHPGHVDYLYRARNLGQFLVVGLNSDASVQRLKGPTRPINNQEDRALVLAGLGCVDSVVFFDEDTPLALIEKVRPHTLVKGGDWALDQIVGREFVEECGGQVFSLPLLPGYSTTKIIKKILSVHQGQ